MSAYLTLNFKLLKSALSLSNADVVEIMSLGGMVVSKTRADLWSRSSGAKKNASGNSDMHGSRISRSAEISEGEFRAFCIGLKPWLDKISNGL